jgi:hypothetical protein
LGSSLARSGLLFEGHRRQRTTVEQLRLGRKFISVPLETSQPLWKAHGRAIRATALAEVDAALAWPPRTASLGPVGHKPPVSSDASYSPGRSSINSTRV